LTTEQNIHVGVGVRVFSSVIILFLVKTCRLVLQLYSVTKDGGKIGHWKIFDYKV